MGLFNEFENSNSNSNTPLTSQNMIRRAPYLTNQERGALMENAMQLPVNNINRRIGAIAGAKLSGTNFTQLRISPLQLSIFNGIVNQNAMDGNYAVDVNSILYKKPHKRKPIAPGSTLGVEVNSILLRYGRMAIGAKHTFTVKPNANAKNKHAHFLAEINGRIFENGLESKFMVKIYKNGKMQFSGGILNNNIRHPEMIRKYIIDTYTPNSKFLYNPIKYVVLVGTFQANGVMDLANIARAFSRSRNASYEPELRPSLKMVHKNYGFQLFRSGKIQIMGAKTTNDLNNAYNVGSDLVKELNVMGLISNFKNINFKPTAKKLRVVKNKTIKNTGNTVSYFNKNGSKNGENGVRIGSKKCATIPRPKLVAVAEKIGIVDITGRTTKPEICAKIKSKVYGKFTIKNKPCMAYTKEQLMPIAITKGVPISDIDTVETICKKLNIPTPLPVNVKRVEKVAKAVNKKVKAKGKVLETRGLTNMGIKKDIEKLYGKKWMNTYRNVMPSINSDVTELKKRINTVNIKKNKAGVPFKLGVNDIKRRTVSEWKMQRKKNLNNKLNAMNNNLAKDLENVMNKNKTPSPPKKKNRFPKGTKVEQL
jgi:TATA-box binding protein (TBP) (component of TFIID and TFIIIB)